MTDLYTVDLDATPEDANWLKSVRTDAKDQLKKSFLVTKGIDLSDSLFVLKSSTGRSFCFLKPEIFKSFYSSKYGIRLTPLGASQSLPKGAILFTGKRGGKYYYTIEDRTNTETEKRAPAGISDVPEASFNITPISTNKLQDVMDDWNDQSGRLSTDNEDLSTREGKINHKMDDALNIFAAIKSHADHPRYNLLTYQDGGKVYGAVLFESRPSNEDPDKDIVHVNYLCSSPEVIKNKVRTGVGSSLLYKVFKFAFVENSKYDTVDLYPLQSAIPFYKKVGLRLNKGRMNMWISKKKALNFMAKYERKYGVKIT